MIIRKVDDLGRIVIPMEVRKKAGWEPGTSMAMDFDGAVLTIRKDTSSCAICGDIEAPYKVNKNFICKECKKEIQNL